MRREMDTGSADGQLIAGVLQRGEIVPNHITLGLLRRHILHDSIGRGSGSGSGSGENTAEVATEYFLVDGYPRNEDNLRGWYGQCEGEGGGMQDVCDVRAVLVLTVPDAELHRRLTHRGLSSGRSDDAADVIATRLSAHRRDIEPILEHYSAATPSVPVLNAICGHQEVGAVAQAVSRAVLPVLQAHLSECTLHQVRALHAKDWAACSLYRGRGERLQQRVRELSLSLEEST